MQIRLAIFNGGQVADVEIPPFQSLPDVIVWGQRFFAFHHRITTPDDPCEAEYREAFAYFVPPTEAKNA